LRQSRTCMEPNHKKMQTFSICTRSKSRSAYHSNNNIDPSRQYQKSNEKASKVLKNRKF
jgi:hypothetical protein